MEMSEQINELAGALAIAQGQMTGALKDTTNTYFNSRYADLAACWDACRKPLSDNKLAVIQTTTHKDGTLYVVTTLAHGSGQWIRGWTPVRAKDQSAQAEGSGLTYARRYGLAAIVGIAQVDDDGNAAQASKPVTLPEIIAKENPLSDKQKGYAEEFANRFTKTLREDLTEEEMYETLVNLKAEANEDQIVYNAAWKLVSAPDRAVIKKITSKRGAN